MVSSVFFLIFAIIGVNNMKGLYFSCNRDSVVEDADIVHKWDCLNEGGEWLDKFYNFNHVLNGMLNLFIISATVGWEI